MDFCSIASGSSGNAIFAGTDTTSVLIDAGISGKRITEGIHSFGRKPEELNALLITHEHIDHIKSAGIIARKYGTAIYGTAGTIRYMKECGGLGKVDESLFHTISPDEDLAIGDMTIHPFRIMHDAAQPVGYRISSGGCSVAVATDMGCYDEYIVENLRNLDGILLESNHDVNMLQTGPYPYPLKQRILGTHGHLSNETAGKLLCEILHDHMKMILLGHLSKENNYEALAYAAVTSEIAMGDNPYRADDFPVTVASRVHPSDYYCL